MPNDEIFAAYKPLRNYLRQLNLIDALATIRSYSQYLWLQKPFPIDVDVHWDALRQSPRVINNWELETLAREIIINSPQFTQARYDLRKQNHLANAINKVKDFENDLTKIYRGKINVLVEIHRMAHRQFPWQIHGFNKIYLTRYFKIFSYPALDKIVKETTGLTTQEIYLLGIATLGVYVTKFSLFYPPEINLGQDDLDVSKLDLFLKLFSTDYESLKVKLQSPTERSIDEKFFYYHDSFKIYPLIRINISGQDSLICPMPALLFWRVTNGIYYELCRQSGFDTVFGESFEYYIGEVLEKANKDNKFVIYPQEQTQSFNAPKIDWIADQDDAALFIECKTKRLTMPAKVELFDSSELEKQLDIIADAALQIYKTIQYYQAGKYKSPKYKYNGSKAIFPIVVILEDWFLMGDPLRKVQKKVEEKMKAAQLPVEWLTEKPFTVMSVQEFEHGAQIIQSRGVKTVMQGKVFDPEKSSWCFDPYLRNSFQDDLNKTIHLFPDDYRTIFPKKIREDIAGL
ncbi:MAG: hypothetical protein HYR90_03630 [Candidatus Andersenbacteria bacterium]|nr:hypothetical protein [Candidatus Andersenbacteria bacterium]MBI3250355.1 hypothetical protein [Candidatus Andersenbacteria bacterium]